MKPGFTHWTFKLAQHFMETHQLTNQPANAGGDKETGSSIDLRGHTELYHHQGLCIHGCYIIRACSCPEPLVVRRMSVVDHLAEDLHQKTTTKRSSFLLIVGGAVNTKPKGHCTHSVRNRPATLRAFN